MAEILQTIGMTAEELLPDPLVLGSLYSETCVAWFEGQRKKDKAVPCVKDRMAKCGACDLAKTDGEKIQRRLRDLWILVYGGNDDGDLVIAAEGQGVDVFVRWSMNTRNVGVIASEQI